ncbi:MAG: exodeoxyribonuclease VII small subunit [Candidatus Marinimicrobia bacterium]|nr:exodeoxyribonuclease VII small subunit [Candidatus Neomarinimicrobiota bacterium]MDD5583090.1 exodeoxyribonuclease VII small subunit [Candidatus Neomarinimicrobiota bacterium]
MTEKKVKKETFEESLTKLESIIKRLESENIPLEEMLKLYEEGISLSKTCRKVLEDAQKKLQVISEQLNDENTSTFE